MAGELACDATTGLTLYAQIWNRTSGLVWNGTTFETYSSASGNLTSYAISLSEQASSRHYLGNAPSTLPAGTYDVSVKSRLNVFYSDSVDPLVANGQLEWNTTVAVPLANLSTSGQVAAMSPIRVARGTQVLNFPVYFRSSSDHLTPFVSGVCSGQISRDGGLFGVLQSGSFTEVGLGYYKVNLTSGDLLANTIAMVFTAVGISGGSADPVPISFITQRTSGQAG